MNLKSTLLGDLDIFIFGNIWQVGSDIWKTGFFLLGSRIKLPGHQTIGPLNMISLHLLVACFPASVYLKKAGLKNTITSPLGISQDSLLFLSLQRRPISFLVWSISIVLSPLAPQVKHGKGWACRRKWKREVAKLFVTIPTICLPAVVSVQEDVDWINFHEKNVFTILVEWAEKVTISWALQHNQTPCTNQHRRGGSGWQ